MYKRAQLHLPASSYATFSDYTCVDAGQQSDMYVTVRGHHVGVMRRRVGTIQQASARSLALSLDLDLDLTSPHLTLLHLVQYVHTSPFCLGVVRPALCSRRT